MSDSDDTDILLLIPPDFFLSSTPPKKYFDEDSFDEFNDNMSASDWGPGSKSASEWRKASTLKAACDWDPMFTSKTENNYKYLPAIQQVELDNINARLTNIETNFSPASDISTISTGTIRNGANEAMRRNTIHRSNIITHSTPKTNQNPKCTAEYHGVLKEIDHFLEDKNYNSLWNGNDDGNTHKNEEQAASLPTVLNTLHIDNGYENTVKSYPNMQENLISLSEMWSKNAPGNLTLKEEQYRRLHLEKTIRSLQSKLLEYQQKISVALEVDKAKDKALSKTQAENTSLNLEVKKLKESYCKVENDYQNLSSKYDSIQKELAQALGLAAKFQDKNEKLENELQSFSKKTTECSTFYKKQIEELELQLHSCRKSEELSSTELSKLKDCLVKAEYSKDKATTRCQDLEKQLENLKCHKEQAQELLQKQKNRADSLEEENKSLSARVSSSIEKETTLQKKLESQRQGLKLHYQQQLESVVAQKLKEFQEQLDKVEETLKQEGRDRERLIAERAMKQMELINEKNEQELHLLQEKHDEEVELYRIQLANASKKINELENKLSSYKTKRADIAEKLHSVMETQWQKALEILTSPNAHTIGSKACSMENVQSTAENEQFETPKTSRQNQRNDEVPHADRLQAYIELLLSKSPQDIENLNEFLAFSKAKPSMCGTKNKQQQRSINGKPPWKG